MKVEFLNEKGDEITSRYLKQLPRVGDTVNILPPKDAPTECGSGVVVSVAWTLSTEHGDRVSVILQR